MNKEYKLYFVVTSNSAYKLMQKTDAKNILISFFYLKKDKKLQKTIREDNSMNILIDSGLYSFWTTLQNKLTDADIEKYCEEYRNFIKETHNLEHIKGYFELDLDLIDKDYHSYVKPIQKTLLNITNKIILIAQKKRSIDCVNEFLKMQKYVNDNKKQIDQLRLF